MNDAFSYLMGVNFWNIWKDFEDLFIFNGLFAPLSTSELEVGIPSTNVRDLSASSLSPRSLTVSGKLVPKKLLLQPLAMLLINPYLIFVRKSLNSANCCFPSSPSDQQPFSQEQSELFAKSDEKPSCCWRFEISNGVFLGKEGSFPITDNFDWLLIQISLMINKLNKRIVNYFGIVLSSCWNLKPRFKLTKVQ